MPVIHGIGLLTCKGKMEMHRDALGDTGKTREIGKSL